MIIIKNLHVFHDEKFTYPFIDFVNKYFSSDNHLFLVIGKEVKPKISKWKNAEEIGVSFKSLKMLLKEMNASDKIFVHSLFTFSIVMLLFLQPWLLKKSYWVVWGGDLYEYRNRKANMKNRVKEFFRAFVIKRFAGLVTEVKGDYNMAEKWYGVQGSFYYSFSYPSNLYKEILIPDKEKEDNVTYIQVGNSADPSNNHIEVFEELKEFANRDIQILVPLSYGNKEYAEKVEKRGKELFGEKFKALLQFIPYEDYLNILAKIDIAIFNHDRQQALGNITSLLSFGKKIYIRDDITTWRFCLDHELTVYSTNNEIGTLFEPMNDEIRKKNQENTKKQFSLEKLIEDLDRIFA